MPSKNQRGLFAAEQAGRVGLFSRGFVYLVGAGLCLRLAFGDRERVDQDGALEALARQRIGSVLLILLAIGFAGYAAWRFTRAVTGAREGKQESGKGSLGRRALDALRGLIYVASTYQALRVLVAGAKPDEGEREKETDLSVTLMQQAGWGRVLVGLLGVGLLAGGAVLAWRGLQEKFTDHLDMRNVPKRWRGVVPVVGQIGYVARGVVLSLVGFFFTRASVLFEPKEVVGISGALGKLAKQPWGPVLLAIIALGITCFAALSMIEARYRKVLEK